MKITVNNIDDIIRKERTALRIQGEDPTEYTFKWGKDGFEALNEFIGSNVCIKKDGTFELHGIFCECKSELSEEHKGIRFLGVTHTWDKRKSGYELFKN